MIHWHMADYKNRMYVVLKDGKKAAMPRYYKEKIYDEYHRIMAGKHQREKMLQEQAELIQQLGIDEYRRQKHSEHLGAIAKYESQNKISKRSKI